MNFTKEKLDLSRKELTNIPPEVWSHKKLRKLSLSKNVIHRIPKEISTLQYLETLDLSNNNLRVIYAKICELKKLRILILNNNNITSIPKQIWNLTNLKILSLSNNNLNKLPAEISQLHNLEELDLSFNKFEKFPEEIFHLKKLKSLWIAQNSFTTFSIQKLKENLPNLKRLYCYSYQLDVTNENLDHDYINLSKVKGNSIGITNNSRANYLLSEEIKLTVNDSSVNNRTKRKIFISYSHKDTDPWLENVQKHLRVLNLEGLEITVWEDTQIKPGSKWKEEIQAALNEAGIAILLISTNFLASEFVRKNELPPLLKAAQEHGTKILPLIISPCRFLKTDILRDFQAVNDPNEPLSENSFSAQERVYLSLVEAVEDHIKD